MCIIIYLYCTVGYVYFIIIHGWIKVPEQTAESHLYMSEAVAMTSTDCQDLAAAGAA